MGVNRAKQDRGLGIGFRVIGPGMETEAWNDGIKIVAHFLDQMPIALGNSIDGESKHATIEGCLNQVGSLAVDSRVL